MILEFFSLNQIFMYFLPWGPVYGSRISDVYKAERRFMDLTDARY